MKKNFSNASNHGNKYIPREYVEKYPLLGKALSFQKRHEGNMNREALEFLQPRGVELIEDKIDRPHGEKEALMVALIFMTSNFNYPGYTYLKHEFSPEVAEIMADIKDNDDGVLGQNYATILTIFKLWEMEKKIDQLRTGEDSALLMKLMMEAGKKGAHEMREAYKDSLFENLNSPALETAYITTERRLLMIAGITKPGPSHNGNGPGLN